MNEYCRPETKIVEQIAKQVAREVGDHHFFELDAHVRHAKLNGPKAVSMIDFGRQQTRLTRGWFPFRKQWTSMARAYVKNDGRNIQVRVMQPTANGWKQSATICSQSWQAGDVIPDVLWKDVKQVLLDTDRLQRPMTQEACWYMACSQLMKLSQI